MPTMQYCSPQDITEIARAFSADIDQGRIQPERLDYYIDRATNITRNILQARFDLVTIENNVPLKGLPREVTYLCALHATILLLTVQIGFAGANEELVQQLKNQAGFYERLIAKGTMTYDDLTNVPSQNGASLVYQPLPTGLKQVYALGVRSY